MLHNVLSCDSSADLSVKWCLSFGENFIEKFVSKFYNRDMLARGQRKNFFSTNALEAGFDQTAIKVIHYSLIHENQENYTICGGPLYYD